MVEKISIELPDEIVKRAHAEADRSGRAVEQIIADWTVRGSEHPLETLVKSKAEYPIYTPFGNEAAAQVLRERLKAYQKGKNKE